MWDHEVWWQIKRIIFEMIVLFGPWTLLWLGITAIAFISGKKKIARWIIRIVGPVTLCVMLWVLINALKYIIRRISIQYGIWLTSCLIVTMIIVLVHLFNKKIRKKKPIHWAIKLAGCVAFYVISFFVCLKLFGAYPGNWLGTDEEYRELAYELYQLNLDCYEYEKIYEGSHGEVFFEFTDISHISDRVLERTLEQRDYITIKAVVEDYIKENISFQGKRIDIWFRYSNGQTKNHIYNFDLRTGEMGTDTPYWFVTNASVNDFTELAEIYYDFAGIRGSVYSMENIQDLEKLSNLTYLQLYMSDDPYLQLYMSDDTEKDIDFEEEYLEEITTILPNCEIYLNQYFRVYPDWENFSD